MTDRQKLQKLYRELKNIEMPVFDNVKLYTLVNTIEQGILFIMGWLSDAAKEHFGDKE